MVNVISNLSNVDTILDIINKGKRNEIAKLVWVENKLLLKN